MGNWTGGTVVCWSGTTLKRRESLALLSARGASYILLDWRPSDEAAGLSRVQLASKHLRGLAGAWGREGMTPWS